MDALCQQYGYASDGESFSIADKDEVWLMELIGKVTARKATTEMLLDSFMGGFLHTLFRLKWELFARRWYLYHLLLDGLYVALLNLTVFLAIFCNEPHRCV